MSEDVEEASKQQMTTRSGRSFGVGPVGDSGDLPSVSGARSSASAAHLASSPSVESHKTQLDSEVGLTATATTESTVPTVATQMDSWIRLLVPLLHQQLGRRNLTLNMPLSITVSETDSRALVENRYPPCIRRPG